jgi:hypothetical protein
MLVLANNKSLLDLGGSFGVNILGNKLNQELLMKAVVSERKRERQGEIAGERKEVCVRER